MMSIEIANNIKLRNPETGQFEKLPVAYEPVTKDSVEEALGFSPADAAEQSRLSESITDISETVKKLPTDVQINGETIVSDGIANIPTASALTLGVSRFASSTFSFTQNGVVNLTTSGAGTYPLRNTTYAKKAVLMENVDDIVRVALTDGKGAAYTTAEQAAARSRINAADATSYNTTIDITLAEDSILDITTDSKGNPLALTTARINILYAKDSPVQQPAYTLIGCYNNMRIASYYTGNVTVSTLAGAKPGTVIYWNHEHGYWSSRGASTSANVTGQYNTLIQQDGFAYAFRKVEDCPTITRIYTSVALLAGTRIIIEGVQI